MKPFKVSHSVGVEFIFYPGHEQLKREIYDWLLHYKDIQKHETNVKATMTEWNIVSPEINQLKDYIIRSLKTLPISIGWGPSWDFKFKNFWANIYRYGEYTNIHDHLPEDLSMVYFLTSEKGDAPLLINDGDDQIPIYPQEGSIVMFPSYIKHSVPKHESNNIRITLSADINRVRD